VAELVSVIVPAYNHERFIGEAIESVLDQTHPDVELIVVDDGSRDATAARAHEFVARYPDRVRLIKQANAGAHQAINVGLRHARGKWLTILNSDDVFSPLRVEKLLAACTKADTGWGFSGFEPLWEPGAGEDPVSQNVISVQPTMSRWPTIGFALLKHNVAVSTGNLFFSRDLWSKVGDFKSLQYLHDWDYALRLLLHFEPVFVPEELYRYRFHGSNSFLLLADVAGRESSYVMRSFFLEVVRGNHTNKLLPSPRNWPGFFESVMRELCYYQYLPSTLECSFEAQARSAAKPVRLIESRP
jgi:glycosyltransferase involved in cell wall biosynthesis